MSPLRRLREYDRIAGISEIARRLFAINAFDGVLTIIGVLMGNFAAGVSQPAIVVSTGIATSAAMGISGLWGAYMTEVAERERSLIELECYTLSDLAGTRIGEASRAAAIVVALVNGVAPSVAGLVVLTPFFLAAWIADPLMIYLSSIAIALLSLMGLGVFLGKVSKVNILFSGLKMLAAGVVCAVVSYLLTRG